MRRASRSLGLACSLLLSVILSACGGSQSGPNTPASSPGSTSPGANNKPLDKVTLRLDFAFLPKHAIFWVAKAKGFYQEAGLDVDIQPGQGSATTAQTVATGQDQFGFSDAGTMSTARAKGAKVKMVSVIHAKAPFAIMYQKKSGIKTAKDLEGKVGVGTTGGSTYVLFPVLEKMAGLDHSKMKLEPVDTSVQDPAFLAGKFDYISAYALSEVPNLVAAGADIGYFLWSDYGFKQYSNGIITSDKLIQEQPDLVKRFVQATMKGVQYASDHQDETADLWAKAQPQIKLQAVKLAMPLVMESLWSDEAKQHGPGYMEEKVWADTFGRMKEFFGIKEDIALKDLYTNEFLVVK